VKKLSAASAVLVVLAIAVVAGGAGLAVHHFRREKERQYAPLVAAMQLSTALREHRYEALRDDAAPAFRDAVSIEALATGFQDFEARNGTLLPVVSGGMNVASAGPLGLRSVVTRCTFGLSFNKAGAVQAVPLDFDLVEDAAGHARIARFALRGPSGALELPAPASATAEAAR
jgi:hypothetical protein